MLLMDFHCDGCGADFEELVESGTEVMGWRYAYSTR
jgi:hypothetical protein